jgi:hypothetical protein
MNKKDLWLRLKAYHFDHIVSPGLWEHITARFGGTDASVKAFAGKIAKKHGWKNHFAGKAITEYKKFIYLGIINDSQVTPPKIIDVVWHEHLLFSKAYRDFCNDVIEQNFDHHPELIPVADQTDRFNAQYFDTMELYKAEFGVEPPPDIWGTTKFDKEKSDRARNQTRKKRNSNSVDGNSYMDDAPLYTYFESNGESSQSHTDFTEFGGGDSGGGGASSDWGDSSGGDSGGDGGGGGCSSGGGGGGD